TKDTLVADVHFFENDNPKLVAQKALRVNLSDLAAMGAEPQGYLLSLALPNIDFDLENWLEAFALGLEEDQNRYRLCLWGGDTVSTSGPITISITAIGQVTRGTNISRSGAKVGDDVYVSGTLGDAAAGLVVLQNGFDQQKYRQLINRYYLPKPRLKLGQRLSTVATSMMDISDGLIGDIAHISENSAVGVIIYKEKFPSSEAFGNLLATNDKYSRLAWSGGDDYELLFTAAPENAHLVANLSNELDIQITKIGEVVSGQKVKLLNDDGSEVSDTEKGFSHF
ncbi:UNVERIFIED_CONTAM: hypothetical protein GTU68_024134, partial [Idotea baltica]|nr:hypothetical protein [Idotea baltica]